MSYTPGPLPAAAFTYERHAGGFHEPERVGAYTAEQLSAHTAAEVARAVAAERERCAKVCERYAEAANEFWPHDETVGVVVRVLSSRIRHVDGLQGKGGVTDN